MTTIACDGKSMAGDGLITDADVISITDYRKVSRLDDGAVAGVAGDAFNYGPFLQWLNDGCEGDAPKLTEGFSCIVLHADGAITQYDMQGRAFPEKAPVAIGSGWKFALAAMDMGKSSEEAVAYAATRDVYTGGEIVALAPEPLIRAVA